MWDFKSIAAELKEAGFRQIRRANFDDAGDEHFKEVEDPSRWQDALGVECLR